eukprot:COSAG02_NODE_4254_length_5581_cov_2.070595_4_plen_199_part_00
MDVRILQDLGLSQPQVDAIATAFWQNMAKVFEAVIQRGLFSWQLLWTGQDPTEPYRNVADTCPGPLVNKATCAVDLRTLCSPSSPAQTRAMMYSFTGVPGESVIEYANFEADVANFLLTRGPHAYLGHGWHGCSLDFSAAMKGTMGKIINRDYGEPTGVCFEEGGAGHGSQIFTREWTKAIVRMDCKTFQPTFQMKQT